MNSRVVGLRVASAVFGLMGLGQLVRLIARIPVHVGSHAVPLWCSGIALIVTVGLAVWLWWLSPDEAKSVPPATA